MAQVGVAQERRTGMDGTWAWDKQSMTREFLVTFDSLADGMVNAVLAAGVPNIGHVYVTANESHPYAFCLSKEAARIAPRSFQWIVKCKYETMDFKKAQEVKNAANQGQEPTFELPEIEFGYETFQVVANKEWKDTDPSNPLGFTNSAGEVFNPPPMKDSNRTVLTITRNEPIDAPHPRLGLLFQDTLNSDTFWGAEPKTVKCVGIKAKRVQKNYGGQQYVCLQCTYLFHFKPETWVMSMLDIGSFYRESGEKKQFQTQQGGNYLGLLDGFGGKVPDTSQSQIVTITVGEVMFPGDSYTITINGSAWTKTSLWNFLDTPNAKDLLAESLFAGLPIGAGSTATLAGNVITITGPASGTALSISTAVNPAGTGNVTAGTLQWESKQSAIGNDPVFIRKNVYPLQRFAALNLPQSFLL